MVPADHKVLNDEQESRLHHRHAVVVQDLATQWIESHPCQTKSVQEAQRSLQTFVRPEENPRSISADNSLEFVKACDELNWNRERSSHTDPKQVELQSELYNE